MNKSIDFSTNDPNDTQGINYYICITSADNEVRTIIRQLYLFLSTLFKTQIKITKINRSINH